MGDAGPARTGTTGKVEQRPKRENRSSSTEVKTIASELRRIYESTIDGSRNYDDIERETKSLLKKPNKDSVLAIARELDLAANLKTKTQAVNAIVRMSTDRKQAFERTRF